MKPVGENGIALRCDVCGFLSEILHPSDVDVALDVARKKGWLRKQEPTRVKNSCPTCALKEPRCFCGFYSVSDDMSLCYRHKEEFDRTGTVAYPSALLRSGR
jgi:hypothetical protein